MSSNPAPLGQLDILDPTGNRLVFDADLAGTGDAMAILVRAGGGERLSVALEPDDVRKLAHWARTVVGLAGEDGRPIDWHATVAEAEGRGAGKALEPVLRLHAPKREQYFDAKTGAPAGSAVECEYCSEQEGDGVDYPCATARAAGARRD